MMASPTTGSARSIPRRHQRADHHRQRRQAVRTGVVPVGDQGRGADPRADADPVDRDPLVAGEPDQAGDDHPGEGVDALGVAQPCECLQSGYR